jgi:hypothetical protein
MAELHYARMNIRWLALVIGAVCVAVLEAGCSSNIVDGDGSVLNVCSCSGCSHPPGACGEPGLSSDDGGIRDATGDR